MTRANKFEDRHVTVTLPLHYPDVTATSPRGSDACHPLPLHYPDVTVTSPRGSGAC